MTRSPRRTRGKGGSPLHLHVRGESSGQRDDSRLSWPWAYAALGCLVLLFFYPILFGNVFISPDSVAPTGLTLIANKAIEQHQPYPLWNPYHFLGMPSFGSLAYVPYVYPPDPLFGFLNRVLHFPNLTWLLSHYLLLGFSMLALLRAFGTGPAAALFGAFALALTPNLVAVGAFGHGSQIMTAAYLPLLLLLLDRFARRGSWLALAGLAFAAAFQLLRGHVQIVFYSWMAMAGYALFLAIAALRDGRRGEATRAIGGFALGLALGFGMSAFLYLPVHQYSNLSMRGGGEGGGAGLSYATSWSFHPREMLTFVIPSMFGFGGSTYWGSMPFTDYPNYMGIIPLILAIYGAVRTRGTARAYLATLAAMALLISFGKHFQALYSLLYFHLPFFNKFRVPVMILVLVQFATAALAALGLEAALRRPEGRAAREGDAGSGWMRGAVLALAGGVAMLLLLNLLAPLIRNFAIHSRSNFDMARARTALDMASIDAIKSGALLATALALIALYRRGRISRSAAALLILGVTAVDLWPLDRRIIDPLIASPTEYGDHFRETPEVLFLRSDSTQFRVFPLHWDDSRLAAFGIASILGYHPAKPRLYQAFTDTVGINSLWTLRLLNVKYILSDGYFPPDMAGVTLRHDGEVKVYEVEGTLPRALMVHSIRQVRDDTVALAVIRTQAFSPDLEAIWAEPGAVPPVAEPALPDSVHTIRYDFNETDYLVATSAPGLFVTVDQFDPDWTATIDGKSAIVHRVNYLMRGIAIPTGVHRVRFAYMPRALAAGIRISVASAIAVLLLAAWGIWRRVVSSRTARAAPPTRDVRSGAGGSE